MCLDLLVIKAEGLDILNNLGFGLNISVGKINSYKLVESLLNHLGEWSVEASELEVFNSERLLALSDLFLLD